MSNKKSAVLEDVLVDLGRPTQAGDELAPIKTASEVKDDRIYKKIQEMVKPITVKSKKKSSKK